MSTAAAPLSKLTLCTCGQVDELRKLYSLIGMDRSGPNAGCVLKNLADFSTLKSEQQRMMMNIISRVDLLVETIINLCVAVLRLDGPSIDSLMTANYDRLSLLPCHSQKEIFEVSGNHQGKCSGSFSPSRCHLQRSERRPGREQQRWLCRAGAALWPAGRMKRSG